MTDNQRSDRDGAPVAPQELAEIPRRVVVGYAVLATAWIVVSDLGLAAARGDDLGERLWDVAKGLLFVAVTTVILWLVLRRTTRSFDRFFARTVTRQRDFYQSVLRTSADIILIFNADGTIRYASDAVTQVLGWPVDDVTGRPGLALLHPDDRMSAISFRENATRPGNPRRTFRMLHRDGGSRLVEISVSSITLDDGRQGAVVNGRDVTDRSRGEQQLRAALAEDATGLPNLRMFVTEMGRLAEAGAAGFDAVVVLVDIDRFGDINSLHGRTGGDAVLLELTRRLDATVPEAIGMWRHGADEVLLVVLDPQLSNDHDTPSIDLTELIERVQRDASAPMALDETDRRLSVDVSVGVARIPLERDGSRDLLGTRMLRAAELALAEAKRHPDRSAVHHDGRAVGTDERAHVVAELREALELGQLVCHYQPKVSLTDLSVVGAEALVRWQHPERGLLLPGDFLASLEAANLTAAMTRVVLGDALAQARSWLSDPHCAPDFVVCVNISLDDLRRKRFVDDVFAAVDASGVDPRRLCLELTEQTMLADALGASTVVSELRRAGIRISIDDFGTGYSSLEHIRVFEVDELKIDKAFVQRITRSRTDEAIVDSIIAIGGRLGVQVVAEGIEGPAALEYLRERGCDVGQGFLFSRAVPPAELALGQTWSGLA